MSLINQIRDLKKQGLLHKDIAKRLGINIYKVNRISSMYVLGRGAYPDWKESVDKLQNIDRENLKRMVLLGTHPLNKLARMYKIPYRHLLTAKKNWAEQEGVRYSPYKGAGDLVMQQAVNRGANAIHSISRETGIPEEVLLYRILAARFRDSRVLMEELKELAEKACKPR